MASAHPEIYRELVESSAVLLWQCDTEGRITFVNPAIEAMLGYRADEVLTHRFGDFQTPEAAERDELTFARVIGGEALNAHATTCQSKSGQLVQVIISAQRRCDHAGVVLGAQGTALLAPKCAQCATGTRDDAHPFRKLVEHAPMAMAIAGFDGTIEFINQRTIKVFGYEHADIPTMERWWLQAYPDAIYRQAVVADWNNRVRHAIANQCDIVGNEYRVTCKDGTVKRTLISGVPVANKVLVLFDDITERWQAEDRLQKSEERYRTLVETTDTGFVIVDETGRVLDANPEYVRLSGHEVVSEVIGHSVLEWTAPEEQQANDAAVAACIRHGSIRNFEVTYVGARGSRVPVEINATAIEVAGHRQILTLCRDITERKRAEELLSIQHELARALNTAPSLTVWFELCMRAALRASGMDCGGIYMLSETERKLRLATHVRLSDAYVDMISVYDADSPQGRAVLAGEPIFMSYSDLPLPKSDVERAEGIRAIAVIPLKSEDRVIGCANIGSHATDDVPVFARNALEVIAAQMGHGAARLRAEEALKQSNDRFTKIFHTIPDPVTISRVCDGKILDANQRFVDVTGYSLDEVVLRDANAAASSLWVRPEDRQRLMNELAKTGEIIGFEAPMRMKNDEVRTGLVSARLVEINGESCVLAITSDITQRKQIEEALMRSEQRYRMVSELASDYVFKLDVATDGQVTMGFVSDNFYTVTGRHRHEAMTVDTWSTIVHPTDLPRLLKFLSELIVRPSAADIECRSYVHGDKLRWINVFAKSYWDSKQQRVTGIIGAVKDISERKLAELRLAAEKERLAVTLRSIGDGVIATDTHGCIEIVNQAAEVLTGWTWEQAQRQPLCSVLNIVDTRTEEPCEDLVSRVLASGSTIEQAEPAVLMTQSGTKRTVTCIAAPIRDAESNAVGVAVVVRDITERQKYADTIQRAAKLESLGVLAGGIAHDFNNLLTGIFGYLDLARSTTTSPPTLECLDAAAASINRARSLTLQLLTFAKGGAPVKKVTAVSPLIQEAVQFALSGGNVACRFAFEPDLWLCDIDKNQIGQVVDNIVINAQHAMPNGGAIEVSAANVRLRNGENPSLPAGSYVRLSFADYGIGIPKDLMPRIFDPFYTTKAKGHGLGLATCYSIVHRHGGCIDVDSEPGKGSTFHVYLPAAKVTVTPQEKPAVKRKGSGTILVVDDEEVIRRTVSKMLELLGYDAVCKSDGRGLADFYVEERASGRRFAALILDLTIRDGMGGVETAAELRRVDTRIPIIVASGYADDAVMQSPAEFGFTASLCKPFTVAELSELLDRHLKSTASEYPPP